MAILYVVVARGTTVLSEFSAVTENTAAFARRILEKLPSSSSEEDDSRVFFSRDGYIFQILRADHGIIFLCMANETFDRQILFSYLEESHTRFMKNYGGIAQLAPAYAMNDFSRVLHQQMEFFSSSPSAHTINRVRGDDNELRTVMLEEIEKML